jgi:riboflavin kinase / FMN adenylyltransferase
MLVISATSTRESGGRFEDTAVTIGVFDGLHRGHTAVIGELAGIKARERLARSIVLTFENHPLAVTHPEMVPPMLTTLDEKLHVLDGLGVDVAIVARFTPEIAGTDYRAFIERELVARLGMKHLVVGYDFRLGRGREGSRERLAAEGKRLGFGVQIVPPVVSGGTVISSTRIRAMILERKLERAGRFLGRPYFFEAEVVRGAGLGRELGFPTANLEVRDARKLLPPGGVYAVEVDAGGARRGGMMNVGSAPTMHGDGVRRIEVHLFDFSGELYGERVRTHCLRYLRDERRFASPEELRAQLMQDREVTYRLLEKKH